jgi:hypothetical protein
MQSKRAKVGWDKRMRSPTIKFVKTLRQKLSSNHIFSNIPVALEDASLRLSVIFPKLLCYNYLRRFFAVFFAPPAAHSRQKTWGLLGKAVK